MQVGQRQPDRADLLPAGREVVDDAPRDDEVRLRVVVAQRQPGRYQKTHAIVAATAAAPHAAAMHSSE